MFTIKKIITCIVSSVFLAVSVFVPLSVSADETEPWYPLDTLLEMTKEEICSISDAYADAYADGEAAYDNNKSLSNNYYNYFNEIAYLAICFYDETAYGAAQDADTMLHTFMTELQLPEQLAPESHITNGEVKMYPIGPANFEDTQRTVYYSSLYCGNYKEYSPRDVFIAVCLTVRFHPNTCYLEVTELEAGSFTDPPNDPPADKTEPWYPLDTLLEMTKEEICSISDEYAYEYHYAENQFYGIKAMTEDTNSFIISASFFDQTRYAPDPGATKWISCISTPKFMTDYQLPEQLAEYSRSGHKEDELLGTFGWAESDKTRPNFYIDLYFDNYKEYSEHDVFIATCLTVQFHPNTATYGVDMPALSPATAPPEADDPAETTPSAVTDPVQTQAQTAAATDAQTTAAADPQTTAVSTTAGQTNTSSPETGDDGTILAVILAGLSLGGCVLMKKMKKC